MTKAELTLRECLLAEAIESANDIEVAKLKARIAELETAIREAEERGALNAADAIHAYAHNVRSSANSADRDMQMLYVALTKIEANIRASETPKEASEDRSLLPASEAS